MSRSRLDELLSKDLSRGRDDAELDELGRLLTVYRRRPVGAWEACEVEGRVAHRRRLDCGHFDVVLGPVPSGGKCRDAAGAEQDVPLSAVCRACYRLGGEA
jgi:hypothetical protein